uniref:MBL fold metallo-hydrolase RNA specificity domain-containing protein n=1 Tax=Cupriavidus yeoncheonensis TaxID=1462994 RepID=UPI003F494A50
MELQFLGATDSVTGSKYVLDTGRSRVMVDCGLFQGFKSLRLRNWEPLPVDPASLDAVILTHAHIDHSGYVPLLVRNGFRGTVFCSMGTAQLCSILLPDSAALAEEDAAYADRKGFSRHRPALPLYTCADAARALRRLEPKPFGTQFPVTEDIDAEFHHAGHIIGAAAVTLHVAGQRIVFSGDLGRQQDIVMRPPEFIRQADCLLVESTYGNRIHPGEDPLDALAGVVGNTLGRGGSLVIPAFAVGRTQALLYCLHRLIEDKRMPDIPIYLNSPMAIDATQIFALHPDELRINRATCAAVCALPIPVQSMEQSAWLNQEHTPKVILAGSGMATGGRVVHHLASLGTDPRCTILLSGFQAPGTRGAALAGGQRELRIHGKDVAIRAAVEQIQGLSAHADANELMTWLSGFHAQPQRVFIVHGEPDASDALRQRVERGLGWQVTMPEYRKAYRLD